MVDMGDFNGRHKVFFRRLYLFYFMYIFIYKNINNMRRIYTKEILEEKVQKCTSWRQLIFSFSLKETGGNYTNLQKKCKEFNVDTSHFTGPGWNKIGHPNFGNSINLEERFSIHEKKQASSKTKEVLLNHKIKENKCEICGITEWNGNPITLQLHHINGDPKDDRLENLQILCPNCHSQTDTFCKRIKIRKTTN